MKFNLLKKQQKQTKSKEKIFKNILANSIGKEKTREKFILKAWIESSRKTTCTKSGTRGFLFGSQTPSKMDFSAGRSMVEMLGVLAIIGVLSIGGISGYTIAIRKHKANEIMNAVNKYAIIAYTVMQKRMLEDPDSFSIYQVNDRSATHFKAVDYFYGCPDEWYHGDTSKKCYSEGVDFRSLGFDSLHDIDELTASLGVAKNGAVFVLIDMRIGDYKADRSLCEQVSMMFPAELGSDSGDGGYCPAIKAGIIVDSGGLISDDDSSYSADSSYSGDW